MILAVIPSLCKLIRVQFTCYVGDDGASVYLFVCVCVCVYYIYSQWFD